MINNDWLVWGEHDTHAGVGYAENLHGAANGNPFIAWYYYEKERYEAHKAGEINGDWGHYINIVNPSTKVTGYSAMKVPWYVKSWTHIQQFDSFLTGISLDAYEFAFENYVANIGYDEAKAELEDAIAELEKIDGTNYKKAVKNYENCLEKEKAAKEAYENTLAEKEEAEAKANASKEAYEIAVGEKEAKRVRALELYNAWQALQVTYENEQGNEEYHQAYVQTLKEELDAAALEKDEAEQMLATATETLEKAKADYEEKKTAYEDYSKSLVMYSIMYDLDGGTVSGNPAGYHSSSTFTLKNPTKEYYKFAGWIGTDLDSPVMTVTIPEGSTGDRKYIATWEELPESEQKYTITYNVKEGWIKGSSRTGYTGSFKSDYTLPEATNNEGTFIGWTGSNGDIPETTVVVPAGTKGNLSYTANWYYEIVYDLDGGTGDALPLIYYDESDTIIGTPEKDGYTFTGWTGDNGETAQKRVIIPEGSSGVKYYTAHWKKNAAPSTEPTPTPTPTTTHTPTPTQKPSTGNTYTIVYHLDGGVVSGNPTEYTAQTETFTLKNPTKKGHTFIGWFGTGINGTKETVTIQKGSTGDRSYTAIWEEQANLTPSPTPEPSAKPTVTPKPSNPDNNTASKTEKAIKSVLPGKANKDAKGASYATLQLKQKKVGNSLITVSWNKVSGASSYWIYGSQKGKALTKLTTTKNASYTQKKLKKGTYYRYIVVAVKSDGSIANISKTAYIATSGGKAANPKKVQLSAKNVKLKAKKSATIKATVKNTAGKVTKLRAIAWESSNQKIATVSARLCHNR